jgi:Fe-S-cluster containining protein
MLLKRLEDMGAIIPQKNIENIFFKKHLRNYSSAIVDEKIHALNQQVSVQIDCTQCANCCKKLEPGLELDEIENLAAKKQMPEADFKAKYIGFDGEAQFLKTKPCLFLADCKCTIYEVRPAACAGYPHLDSKDLKYKRSLWSNYSICPIVFNVIELLKKELNFTYASK